MLYLVDVLRFKENLNIALWYGKNIHCDDFRYDIQKNTLSIRVGNKLFFQPINNYDNKIK